MQIIKNKKEMKYLDKFTYWLIDNPIFELAYYRKNAIDKIRSLSGTVLTHFIKVLYIDDDLNKNHWINEIIEYFNRIDEIRIKPNNKKFQYNEYLNFLLVEPYCESNSSIKKNNFIFIESYIGKIINRINSDYKTDIKYENIDFNQIINFFKLISLELEKDSDIDNIIKNYFLKNKSKKYGYKL